MLSELMKKRGYPDISAELNEAGDSWREVFLEKLEKYSYGHTPPAPISTRHTVLTEDTIAYAGKVTERTVSISFTTERGEFSFPVSIYIPNRVEKPPVFLHLAFRPVPDRYIPVEEICDGGFALCVMVYTDVVNDAHYGDYSDGLGAYFGIHNPREPEQWGKIGMWAYAASRVMDEIEKMEELDARRVAVVGHSRLGKTALWCAAQDERIAVAISNNSGYGGAASSRASTGEKIPAFLRLGSWDWFCENFKSFTELEDEKPYDQAHLLSLIAPRPLLVLSAEEDKGADPTAEFLTTLNASAAWERLGKPGLITPDVLPTPTARLFDGTVGYFLRRGRHFLSREDWGAMMEFLRGMRA